MNGAGTLVELAPAVTRDEARRCLGYPDGRQASRRAAERLDGLWRSALELLTPRGAFALVDQRQAHGAGVPGANGPCAVAVCTVGAALEGVSARLAEFGSLLDALVLDAIGSAAAEATRPSMVPVSGPAWPPAVSASVVNPAKTQTAKRAWSRFKVQLPPGRTVAGATSVRRTWIVRIGL